MGLKRSVSILALTLVAFAPDAGAFVEDGASRSLEIPRPQHAVEMNPGHSRALAIADQVQRELGGDWKVFSWNPALNTPRWVTGSGIELVSAATATADDVALAFHSREFIETRPTLFRRGATDLVEDDIVRGRGKVAVHFRQQFHGVPVVEGFATLVYHEASGRLYAFGSKLYADIDVSPVPVLSENEAVSIAKQSVPFDPLQDEVLGEPELVIVPINQGFETAYHLAWRVRVTTAEPFGIWVTHVDAHSGEIVWRTNDVHFAYEGTVVGDVEINGYCDGVTPNVALGNLEVTIDGIGVAETDTTGAFTIPGDAGAQTVTARLRGPNFRVVNAESSDASFEAPIQPNVPLVIEWNDTNSHPAERDVYYWMEATKRYIQNLDSSWGYAQVVCSVNVNAACNANFGGTSANFFRELGGCANTGQIGDVVAHEFGHGIQGSLLGNFQQGNEGLGEGNSDIAATFMSNDPVIGRGFNLNVCTSGIRNCDNTLIYPNNVVGQPIHSAGRVICGFNWDLREEMEVLYGAEDGKTRTAELWHYARKVLKPFFQPDQVLAYFVIDDDDGNLLNGTPHFDQICAAAGLHNFDCPETGILLTHTPLEDTFDTTNPYVVEATILSFEGSLLPDSVRVFYRLNSGAFDSEPMTTGDGSTYEAGIPPQSLGTVVQYYILARDEVDNRVTSPEEAPGFLHGFVVGGVTATLTDDMETGAGWTVGPNTATAGIWERVDPIGNFTFASGLQIAIAPEDDHTEGAGTLCWITEQEVPGQLAGAHDVDSGFTTLLSPVYDLSTESYARLEYYLWFNNDLGNNPGEDPFEVEASSNGGSTWINVDSNFASTTGTWERRVHDLSNFVDLTSQMRFRFIARDDQSGTFGPSLVEAGFDDLAILVPGGGTTAVSGPAGVAPQRFALEQNQPNPFNPSTTIRFALAADSRVTLGIYDVTGKLVRTLVDEPRELGVHALTWDGTDQHGGAVSSGIYFYRLDAGDFTQTRKMVLLK